MDVIIRCPTNQALSTIVQKHANISQIVRVICHTVKAEGPSDPSLVYKTSSPDEAACVKGIARLGCKFLSFR